VFGGPYSNLRATEALLAEAGRMGIPSSHILCTGDLAAYCGSPAETIDLIRRSGIASVMGNCDEQLGSDAEDCGCGFPSGSACERFSSAWFSFASSKVGKDARKWLAALPRRIGLEIANRRLAVIHGSVSQINSFIFESTPQDVKRRELDLAACDGVIAGHCGVPFTEFIGGRMWHNAGVVGMPANDGTPNVWYSLLTQTAKGLRIEHRALAYDHEEASKTMRAAGLPPDYRDALASGLWPSCDVLPEAERRLQGVPLRPGKVLWKDKTLNGLAWPRHSEKVFMKAKSEKTASGFPKPDYHATARSLYRDAALKPDEGLCCTSSPIWQWPELRIPSKMLRMNYGCGSTVHPRDLARAPAILYVGVGGGLELLQFAYFSRRKGAVIGIDIVDEMIDSCRINLRDAEEINPWFKPSFIELKKGDALRLPVPDATIDVAAQNCLFNIFRQDDLDLALSEMHRILKPGGKLVLSDPICEHDIPSDLRRDDRLRAMCLTGAIPLAAYVERLGTAGFGTVEIRAKRPYRVLSEPRFVTPHPIIIESVELCAIKGPVPASGPNVFSGRTAIYHGREPLFEHGGVSLAANQPQPVADRIAALLEGLRRDDLYISPPAFFDGSACC
jgi:SAM-dependent methyltransferase